MRTILAIILLLSFLWGGYWYVGANRLETELAGWFDARRTEGWQADYAKITTRGFPNRFDTTINGIALADPETGWAWTASFFQILSLSYNPGHVIAIWPHAHTLATPNQSITIASDDMRGSVVFSSVKNLELDRSQFVVTEPRLSSTGGWTLEATELRFATRTNEDYPFAHHIGLEAVNLDPGGWFDTLVSGYDLPQTLQEFRLDATASFSKPWDRSAIEVARPQPRHVDLTIARAAWGDLLIQAAGAVDIDSEGTPTGEMTLQVRNWRTMVDMLVTAEALPQELRSTVEGALEALAGLSGNPDYIDVTLSFRAGLMMVGLVPVGTAPKLVLR